MTPEEEMFVAELVQRAAELAKKNRWLRIRNYVLGVCMLVTSVITVINNHHSLRSVMDYRDCELQRLHDASDLQSKVNYLQAEVGQMLANCNYKNVHADAVAFMKKKLF